MVEERIIEARHGDPGAASHRMTDAQAKLLARYAGSTILVTGGLGFIGSALVQALSSVPCRIVLLVRAGKHVEVGSDPGSEAEIVAVPGDIGAGETWDRVLDGVDHVFHFAAQTSAPVAERDPLADLNVNVLPVLQMLEACRRNGLKPKVIFAGTTTQVGIPPRLPVDESFQDLPVVIYDVHKLVAEKYLQYYAHQENIPTITLRLANVFGPGTNVSSGDRGVLNRMMLNALSGNPLTVYGDGGQVRDYVYIEDVVRAFLTAGAEASNISGNYYVIGSGTGFRIVDAVNLVADRVEQHTGRRPEVTHVPPPSLMLPIDERDFVADTGLFQAATGWAPKVSLSDGIDLTLADILGRERTNGVDHR